MRTSYIVFCFAMALFTFVYAQESWYKMADVQLDGNKVSQAMADVGNVEVDFCNASGDKSVAYDVVPWEENTLCYVVSNFSNQELDVHIWFVDGTFTNDQWKNRACKQEWEIKDFGQYVTGYQDVIHIPARGEAQYFASLQFPEEFTGTRNGCLVYYLGGVEMWWTMNFTVLMRRAKFIDVQIVQGPKSNVKSLLYLWIFFVVIIIIILAIKSSRWAKKKGKK